MAESPRAGAAMLALLSLLSCGASQADTVVVYTERQPVFLEQIFEAFTAQTAIEVEELYLDKGVVTRLRSEGEHSPADVAIVADVGRIFQLVDNGLLQSFETAGVQGAVPGHLRSLPDGWTALTQRYRVAYVPLDAKVTDLSWEELGGDDLGNSVCIRSGAHPYNVALFSSYLYHHGESGTKSWLDGLKGNLARKPQGNDRAQIKGVASGICDVGVANLYYYFKMANSEDEKEWEAASKVRWVPIGFANKGVHANVSGIALARHAPNKGAALKLIDFMVGKQAQLIYAGANYELPVRHDVMMPGELDLELRVKVDDIPLNEMAGLRNKASSLVEEARFDD